MTFKKTIVFIAAITAAILVPLGLIAGAVSATVNYSDVQVTSTPEATINVSDVTDKNAHIYCSIDRSNLVIDASTNEIVYTSDYEIYLIDMTRYNNAVKNAGNQVVSLRSYILHTVKVRDNVLYYDGMEVDGGLQSFSITDTYLLTADTVFQEGTDYYTLEGNNYVLANVNYGTEVEKDMYYVKVKNTSFDFYIGNLSSKWDYAIAIQFYYSKDGKSNNGYNSSLTTKTEFTTK